LAGGQVGEFCLQRKLAKPSWPGQLDALICGHFQRPIQLRAKIKSQITSCVCHSSRPVGGEQWKPANWFSKLPISPLSLFTSRPRKTAFSARIGAQQAPVRLTCLKTERSDMGAEDMRMEQETTISSLRLQQKLVRESWV